jgi:hypothetical protein
MEILLCILALSLVCSIGLIGFVFAFLRACITLKFKRFREYSFNIAKSLDQLGNVVMSPLFNLILIKTWSPNKFGDADETISSVLGRNQKTNTLAYLGRRLVAFLDAVDDNHSIKSIGT